MKITPLWAIALVFLAVLGFASAKSSVSTSNRSANHVTPLQHFVRTIQDAKRHLAAAAVARSVSIFTMYPIDTIKTRIQMDLPSPFRLSGLYTGVAGSLLGQVPYGVLTFGSYEMYKKGLLERLPNVEPIFTYALAAILGDLTGSFWLCPSEVVKQQLQAGMFTSTTEAFTSIWNSKGLRGLYQGYWGGVTRDVPFRVAQLTTYEVTKTVYLKYKKNRQQGLQSLTGSTRGRSKTAEVDDAQNLELSPIEAAFCGAIAGSFSAAITAPLDRIKTIMMTDSSYGGTVAECAGRIFREEGLGGFATGVVPRVVYIAPSVAIFFIAYEQVQQRLQTTTAATSP